MFKWNQITQINCYFLATVQSPLPPYHYPTTNLPRSTVKLLVTFSDPSFHHSLTQINCYLLAPVQSPLPPYHYPTTNLPRSTVKYWLLFTVPAHQTSELLIRGTPGPSLDEEALNILEPTGTRLSDRKAPQVSAGKSANHCKPALFCL